MMTLSQLMAAFPDEESCKAHLAKLRWADGKVRCPRCNMSVRVYALKSRPWHWVCKACAKNGYRFSLTAGTIFEHTRYPLRVWFQVLYLMLQSKKGMSALQIHRTIGSGSYETAWYMCHRLRAAMKDDSFRRLTGVVEMDETYVGGKEGNRHVSKRRGKIGLRGKAAVVGAIARKGNVVCQMIERVDADRMGAFAAAVVSDKVTLVATDEANIYKTLDWGTARHEHVTHTKGEYVRGQVHTANLDSFWSLLKRGIVGTFHQVSKSHLPLYLNEFSFRHNHRADPDVFDRVLESC